MANLPEISNFDAGVYQIETGDPVLGGVDGISNLQAKALANRTKYLKDHVDALETAAAGNATQSYVQAELQKLDHKNSVRVATTANITISGLLTIDGVTLVSGDRVLVKNQTTASQNGIYVAAPSAWVRAADADTDAKVTSGLVVGVNEGATQANSRWQLTTDDPITLGTTALVFADTMAGYAPLASPALTGTPTTSTPSAGDNSNKIASTAFVANAVDGLVSVNVAGNTDKTLTAAQGGTGIIELTGALTGNINLNLPAGTGTYLISNKTSGAYNITAQMTGGPGSSVVLPQGTALIIYSDGTNVKAASSAGQAFLSQQNFTPAAGVTTLTVLGGYTPGAIIVTKNGAVLKGGDDYTATVSPDVTLSSAAVAGDEFTVYAFTAFQVADALKKSGDTMTGALTLAGNAGADLQAIPRQQLRTTVGVTSKALALSSTGFNSNVSVSADELVLRNTAGDPLLATGVSLTVNAAAAGAGGLDAGTLAGSTWYAVWVISNGTTVAGMLSTSATAPTMPSGYTYRARVGWIRTDGTVNKYPLPFTQRGDRVQYSPATSSNLVGVPIMASGAAGNPVNVWAPVAVSAFVPPSAKAIHLMLRVGNNGSALCAPNPSYGGVNDTSRPSPMSLTVTATTHGGVQMGSFLLETFTLQWASDLSTNLLACMGWEDSL